MLRVSSNWTTKSCSSFVQTLNILRKMSHEAPTQIPDQHDNLPSDFPTTTTTTPSPIDTPPAVEDSPFVPDFDASLPIRPGENPPTPSPSPTAPRTDSPEFSDPPNISPPGREAPRPPTSPPGQPDATPRHATPPKQPPDPGEQIRTSNVRSE